jgi:hypothetical protein
VYEFFDTIFVGSVSPGKLWRKFFFSEKAREQKKGKLILMVRLFYALSRQYLEKINVDEFPAPALRSVRINKNFKGCLSFRLRSFGARSVTQPSKIQTFCLVGV